MRNEQQKAGTLVVASVYDAKVGTYFQPFFARTRAEALRSFKDTVNQQGHVFNKHPQDFTLFILAVFDEETGGFLNCQAPESMGTGHEYLERPEEDERQMSLVGQGGTA